MAITLKAHRSDKLNTPGYLSSATTGSIDTTGADLLVLAIVMSGSGDLTFVDSKGNTWSALAVPSGQPWVALYYAKNPIVGAGHTITCTDSYGKESVFFTAFAGSDTTSPLDAQNGAQNNSTTSIAPGSITPGADNELVITVCGNYITSTPAVTTLTLLDTIVYDYVYQGGALAYEIQTAATARNPTWSGGAANTWAAKIASFKAAPPKSRAWGMIQG